MSSELISRSPDLRKLTDKGFEIEVRGSHLVLHGLPYIGDAGAVSAGKLVSVLELSGEQTASPSDHTVYFQGEFPRRANGEPLEMLRNHSEEMELEPGLKVQHRFSAKPRDTGQYRDYYEKMSRYAEIISREARILEPGRRWRGERIVSQQDEHDPQDPFLYTETASGRAGITDISNRVSGQRIAIIGLGGSGSYILDLVSKTRVKEIHLFDHDEFLQHNVFRAPGAWSLDELRRREKKAKMYERRYGAYRTGVIGHGRKADRSALEELGDLDFVFVSVDDPGAKKDLFQYMEEKGIPFVDVGMGLDKTDGKLQGILRVTGSREGSRATAWRRVQTEGEARRGEYDANIQTAELNALNASLAVLYWKKQMGIYADSKREIHSTFTTSANSLANAQG